MALNVKNTTKKSIIDLVCPHYCRGCGRLGSVLCECCKKHNIDKNKNYCPVCHKIVTKKCKECALPLDAIWTCGWRDENLGVLVEEYKYSSVMATGKILAEILDQKITLKTKNVVVVPLPTITRHIRERGLDHTYNIAKKLAKRRGWRCEKVLMRKKNTVQVGMSMDMRKKQAEDAYKISGKIDDKVTYLLLDDVWTTGASMLSAEKTLRKAGAKKIVGAVLVVSRLKEELLADESGVDANSVKNEIDDSKS